MHYGERQETMYNYLNIQNVVPPEQLLKISFFFSTPNCITTILSTTTHLNHYKFYLTINYSLFIN